MRKGFSGVGEFSINGNDLEIDGVTSFEGGEFNRVNIDGVVSLKNELKANELYVDGVFKAASHITANRMVVDGVADFQGNVRCHNVIAEGVINLKKGKLEADELRVDGVIKAEGEINADRITADGNISAKEIYGDEISICSKPSSISGVVAGIGKFLKGVNLDNDLDKLKKIQGSKIGILEATKVTLQYVEVKQLCGSEITIGEGCCVENVDCDGHLKISRYAVVKNVNGKQYEVVD